MLELFKIFFSAANPLFFILLALFFLVGMVYFFTSGVYLPIASAHKREQKKNEKLLSLFTTLSPNPVFRVDAEGRIQMTNQSGAELFRGVELRGKDITEFIPSLRDSNLNELISLDEERVLDVTLGLRDFNIIIKSVPELRCLHLYCFDITDRLEYERKLEDTQNRLRELAVHVQDLDEANRNNISMELHDGVCQTVTSIKLTASQLDKYLSDNSEANEIFSQILSRTDEAINEIRGISHRLTPKFLKEFGLITSIQNLVNQAAVPDKLFGSFDHYGIDSRLEPKLEVAIYRITQELIANISKHSKANDFSIQLFQDEKVITLLVEDNGIGFSQQQNKKQGLGLLNIIERVHSFNGSIAINSNPNQGTEIMITIPLGGL